MSKNTAKTMNSKLAAQITLAVLLVITLAFTVFGITGTDKNQLYYYQNWIPASFTDWPEAIKADGSIAGTRTCTFTLNDAAGNGIDLDKVISVYEKRLGVMGIPGAKVTAEDTTVTVTYPVSSVDKVNGDVVAAALQYQGNLRITWGDQDVLTAEDIAYAKTYAISGGNVMEIGFTKEAKAKLHEAQANVTNNTLYIYLDGNDITGGGFTVEDAGFIDKGLYLTMNDSDAARLQSLMFAAGIGGGDMGVLPELTASADNEDGSCAVPMIILAVAAFACFIAMIILCKDKAIAGVWSLVGYIAVFFFCIAELLSGSGYITLLGVIIIALSEALFTWNYLNCAKAIKAEEASRSLKSAIPAGFKSEMKMFYIINGAVFALGFILGFIPGVKFYGFLLMIAVLLNIVFNRLFSRLLLKLLNKALSR